LSYFTVDNLKHIAYHLDIAYDRGIYKSDLIELINLNYFPDEQLNKRRIKKILKMFYKYQMEDICKKMGGWGYSSLNTEELYNYIVEICLSEDDENFDNNDDYISEDDNVTTDIEDYSSDDFLKLFMKGDLQHIADNFDIEYYPYANKDTLIELISSKYFPNGIMTESKIKVILDMFYKYELERIFDKIFDYSFTRINTAEVHDLIANHFRSSHIDEFFSEEEISDDVNEQNEENYSIVRIKILITGAQPVNTVDIELMNELEKMKDIIRSFPLFKLIPRYGSTPDNFNEDLSYFKPQILHLTAHGNKGEILFEDDRGKKNPRKMDMIADLIKIHNKNQTLNDSLIGLILSSCYSEVGAKKLVNSVNFVIAMSDSILVDSAIQFVEGFYSGIKSGKNIQDSFDSGLAYIIDKNEKNIPILLLKNIKCGEQKLIIYQ